jgi:hypothetical protein
MGLPRDVIIEISLRRLGWTFTSRPFEVINTPLGKFSRSALMLLRQVIR